jgi:hypothetical protein
LREQGNEAYRAGEYEQALKHYQEVRVSAWLVIEDFPFGIYSIAATVPVGRSLAKSWKP